MDVVGEACEIFGDELAVRFERVAEWVVAEVCVSQPRDEAGICVYFDEQIVRPATSPDSSCPCRGTAVPTGSARCEIY